MAKAKTGKMPAKKQEKKESPGKWHSGEAGLLKGKKQGEAAEKITEKKHGSEVSLDAKEEKKQAAEQAVEGKKQAGVKKKPRERMPKIEFIPRPAELKILQQKIRKKHHPVFRGRFGKKKVRKVHDEKWDRWRKPRGIDIVKRKEDGYRPRSGYRTPAEIRYRHPSGYYARIVNNPGELEVVSGQKHAAAMIASGVGKRKRREILKRANELKVVVLNR